MTTKSAHVIWHDSTISKTDRQRLNNHKSGILWFTGLSGAGKSTIAGEVEKELYRLHIRSYVLDGDNVRHGLNRDLGFSPEDRNENIRRIGEVAALFVDAGLFVLSAFISPYQKDRDRVREMVGDGEFIEIYVQCSVEECERRDPKGLYQKARKGEIKEFTGISAPYESPQNPELIIHSEEQSVQESVDEIMTYLRENEYIQPYTVADVKK